MRKGDLQRRAVGAAEFDGGEARCLFEEAGKVVRALEIEVEGDLRDGVLRLQEKTLRLGGAL